MKNFLNFFLFIIIWTQLGYATVEYHEPIKITGQCDQETISATISPDQFSVSLLFDNNLFLEHLPEVTKARVLNKYCVFRIPLKATPKDRYEIMGFDWRGFAVLPTYSSAIFQSRVWLTHNVIKNNGKIKTIVDSYTGRRHHFMGPYNNDFFMNQKLSEPKRVTECGTDYTVIIELEMKLKNKNNISNSQVGIDSLDIAQSTSNFIVKRPCEDI